jgi:aminoglycoside 6'-N-acetyltransferase
MSDPDVAAWYEAEELSLTGMEREFGDIIDGADPVQGYLIVIDKEPAGYIQAYRLSELPNYFSQLGLDRDRVSTDLFLGHAAYRNHGWGVPVLRAFLHSIVFGHFGADRASILPNPENARAIKVYERVGFVSSRVVAVHDAETGKIENELIMLLDKDQFLALEATRRASDV